jgi:putative chitinase
MPTEDGWEPSPRIEPNAPLLVWRQVPGTDVTLQVRNDDAGTVMLAYAADYHANVEPLRDADSACYTPTNSVSTSNHLNATAMDLNWDSHPFQTRGTFNADQMSKLRDLLAFYKGVIFWAGDWDDPVDEMHHQMDYGSYDQERSGQLAAWIKANIRPDGFSIYHRDTPAPPVVTPVVTPTPPVLDPVGVLAAAVGISTDAAATILPAITQGLIGSNCTNVNRIAMWLAQEGEESASFTATVEIGDLDGSTYQGRTWEQITGAANYAAFSKWCFSKGLVPTATYFADNPAALGDPQWESLGAVWYWTVARPAINGMADAGDVQGVTQAINGGLNGLAERQRRYNLALAQGDALLTLLAPAADTGGTVTLTVAQDQWNQLLADVAYIKAQLGPTDPNWGPGSSFGKDASGNELTQRDGLVKMGQNITDVEGAVVAIAKVLPQLAPKPATPQPPVVNP